MASLKFPDISVSTLEAGRAMKERESKSLIFKVQIVSVFLKWYTFGGPGGISTTEEETIQSYWIFSSDSYVKSEIKEKILKLEEGHKTKYQDIISCKYKSLRTYDIIPNTYYTLEVDTK